MNAWGTDGEKHLMCNFITGGSTCGGAKWQQCMRDASDGMASVNTWIGYGSQLKERVNGQPKKSDIGNKSELSIKTCSVNEAIVWTLRFSLSKILQMAGKILPRQLSDTEESKWSNMLLDLHNCIQFISLPALRVGQELMKATSGPDSVQATWSHNA